MKTLRMVAGALLVLLGLIWTGQGLGWIGGSFMTGQRIWALIGLVFVIVGVLLVLRARSDR